MNKVIFWNCRGTGTKAKCSRNYLHNMIRDHSPYLVFLLETRQVHVNRRFIDKLFGRRWSFAVIPSQGNSGGIILAWDDNKVNIHILLEHRQVLLVEASAVNGGTCITGGVYASNDEYQRKDLWETLKPLLHQDMPVVLGGDFNCIVGQEEKKGGRPFRDDIACQDFLQFMQNTDLRDAGYSGSSFTWCNNQSGGKRIWERLDRVLFNSAALVQILGLQVSHLARIGSDHCPLLLSCGLNIFRPQGGVKFEDVWLTYEQATVIVRNSWRYSTRGSPSTVLSKKSARTLRALKK
ncbi:hypothetical protein AXF42_Ash020404 [Apostasia shenzhenica]|uniref:Endonuclease/exonuclease/phosphatase domain-containing protein n=1 Tax=Apostasia shenzhenica TaxID=1088818 RepID=A0A2I0AA64_9ASPA|nr:hypothetical protein AXF42_Ash020404 [Apostasia shenzhenica]